MLLDTASLYFRAFYGVPDDRAGSPAGPATNAVRGLLDMVATLLTTYRPSHLVACWDDDWRPAWRVAALPTYKAHRLVQGPDGTPAEEVPERLAGQVPVIAEVLAALGIARWGAAGFEADDVIGTLTTRARGVMPVDVVTGDRDLFQLVDDAAGVRVLYTARGGVRRPDLVDQDYLARTYQVGTGDGYADLATLRGDPSDGLPGVRGVGEKTAAALLTRYGSLAGVVAAVEGDDPGLTATQRARLLDAADYLRVAPRVVRVARDVSLPDGFPPVPAAPADPAALAQLVARYRLAGPVERVGAAGTALTERR